MPSGRIVTTAALLTASIVAACSAPTSPRTRTPATTLTPFVTGQLVGGIQRCYGIGLPPGQTPQFVAGTVDVYSNNPPLGGGLMAQADVLENGMFHLTLPAGNYVVVGSISGSNLSPELRDASVRPDQTTRVDIVFYGCI